MKWLISHMYRHHVRHPFQSCDAFHIETAHLFCIEIQMACFFK